MLIKRFFMIFFIGYFLISCSNKKNDIFRDDFKKVSSFGSLILKRELDNMGDLNNPSIYKVKKKLILMLKIKNNNYDKLFFNFKYVSLNKQTKGVVKIFFKRAEKKVLIKEYYGNNIYHSFYMEKKLKKGDKFIINVIGNGYFGVNKPVFENYDFENKKNYIIVIALDTMRKDMINKKFNGINITKNINKFIKDSVSFENVFSQSSWTLPSFMSFFTGLREYELELPKYSSLDPKKNFFIDEFKKRYFTVNFNADLWLQGKYGFSRGFDHFYTISTPDDNRGGRKLFNKAKNLINNKKFNNMFLFLHTYQIHSPYNPPGETDLFDNIKYKKLDSFFYEKQFKNNVSDIIRSSMIKLYELEILTFDKYFGDFIRYLKDKGIYDKSLIVFMSDHGEEFYEHKGWAHGHSLYNEIIKVPLYIKFPNNEFKGKVIKNNIELRSILPTIMEYKGFKLNSQINKLSVYKYLNNSIDNGDKYVVSSTSLTKLVPQIPEKFTIIHGKYKLYFNFPYSKKQKKYFSKYGYPPDDGQLILFDISQDKFELNPINENEKQRIIKKYFSQKINEIKRKILNLRNKKFRKKLKLSDKEKQHLKSLGYL